jgi:chemotaxis protein MotA
MNFSSLFGIIFGVSILYAALSATTDNMAFFFDLHGVLIVVGGTLAASSISFPIFQVLGLLKVFLLRVLGKHSVDYTNTISQILDLNKKVTTSGLSGLTESLPSIRHEFLKEALSLVASGVLTEPEIRQTLEQRLKTVEMRLMQEANMFRAIGRFPPAFGLLATTLGMIGLLQKIGQPDSQKLIGPAMSIGLIGTLYGIALSNLILIPIAENLTERTHEEMALRRMMVEGALMLKQQSNPIALREGLNSFLLPKDRVNRKSSARAA